MSQHYQERKKANEKYLATQDRITIRVSKESGLKDAIQAHADSRGESVQAFILRAIQETMYNDTHKHTFDSGKATMQRMIEQYNQPEGD